MDNSAIYSTVEAGAVGNGGQVKIDAENLSLKNGGQINTLVRDTQNNLPSGEGIGGNVIINVDDTLSIDGVSPTDDRFRSHIFSDLATGAKGKAGNIEITAGRLTLTNGGLLSSSTRGVGDAGNIKITAANNIIIDGFLSGIVNTVLDTAEGNAGVIDIATKNLTLTNSGVINNGVLGKGDGGNVKISTDNLTLTRGGKINSSTYSNGNAGNIDIRATDTIFADNVSIVSIVGDEAEGSSGDIEITTGNLTLTNVSQINNSVFGKGNGGSIKITAADTISVDNDSFITSEIFQGAEGNAGGIDITTNNLTLANEGEIAASTNGRGIGGNIKITANDSISVDNGNILSVVAKKGEGNAGEIEINTNNLNINNGGAISTGIQGKGDGGKIKITATDNIVVNESFIGSAVLDTATGNGGVIDIRTPNLFLNNGTVLSTQSIGQGNAGNIKVSADSFTLDRGSYIFASNTPSANISSNLSGGNITLQISDRLTLSNNSDISTEASSNANGGNIDIVADAIIAFDDSDIFAFAQEGRGGNITLNTPAYFGYGFNPTSAQIRPDPSNNVLNGNNRADINATGAIAGIVNVPDVSFIQNGLTELPENPIDTNALIANSCIARRDRGGTFTVTGAGGLPNRPGDAAVSPYPTGDVRGVESDRTSNNSTHRAWKIGDPIVEPQAAYRLADGQMVLSRECEQ